MKASKHQPDTHNKLHTGVTEWSDWNVSTPLSTHVESLSNSLRLLNQEVRDTKSLIAKNPAGISTWLNGVDAYCKDILKASADIRTITDLLAKLVLLPKPKLPAHQPDESAAA